LRTSKLRVGFRTRRRRKGHGWSALFLVVPRQRQGNQIVPVPIYKGVASSSHQNTSSVATHYFHKS
jgi:hypothetical protein